MFNRAVVLVPGCEVGGSDPPMDRHDLLSSSPVCGHKVIQKKPHVAAF